ncbi:MAG: rhomboid family intramembrane serine protease [Candidatus Manganitrophaceae bacterium]
MLPTDQPPPISPDSNVSAPQAESVLPQDRQAEFQRTLAGLTPRVYVTPVLIGVNVLVFILMTATGVSPTDPTIPDLLLWGANFGPKTTSGEWWRLLTSLFIHIGISHILLNMWVLSTAGPLVERMIGNVGLLLLYLAAGLTGSVTSLFWNPLLVSAGASGAIFGIYGALLGLLLRQHSSIPREILTQLRNSGLGFLFYNLVYGMMQPNIDSAAHIGGLAGGFLGGIVLSQPFTPEALAGRPVRNLLVSGLGVLLIIGGMIGVHGRHADLANVQSELERFEAVEKKALGAFNSAVGKAQRQELTDPAFADLLEREVLPEWRATRERLIALKQIPAPLQHHVASILEYMRLREEAWAFFVQALREGSPQKAQQAMEKQKLADAAVEGIIDSADK